MSKYEHECKWKPILGSDEDFDKLLRVERVSDLNFCYVFIQMFYLNAI